MVKITNAAIKSNITGEVYYVPKPGRHSDVIFMMVEQGHASPVAGIQGFITSNGQFVDRRLAFAIAYLAKQITQEQYDRRKDGIYELFSEDVWKGHFQDYYLEQYIGYIKEARRCLLERNYDRYDWCGERARNIWRYKLEDDYKEKALEVLK